MQELWSQVKAGLPEGSELKGLLYVQGALLGGVAFFQDILTHLPIIVSAWKK